MNESIELLTLDEIASKINLQSEEEAWGLKINFSESLKQNCFPYLNPPPLLDLCRRKDKLYPWLQQTGLCLLSQIRVNSESLWPLWSLSNKPKLCHSATDALSSQGSFFVEHPQSSQFFSLFMAGGQIIQAQEHNLNSEKSTATNDLPLVVLEQISSLSELYGLELAHIHVLVHANHSSILDIDLPLKLPAHLVPAIITAFKQKIALAKQRYTNGYLQTWQIISIMNSLLQASCPQTKVEPWQWYITPHNPELPNQNQLQLTIKESIALNLQAWTIDPQLQELFQALLLPQWPIYWPQYQIFPSQSQQLNLSQAQAKYITRILTRLQEKHAELASTCSCLLHKALKNRYHISTQIKTKPALAILTLDPRPYGEPFAFESWHFYQLAALAPAHDLDIILCSCTDFDFTQRELWGYSLHKGRWLRTRNALPDVIYIRGTKILPEQEPFRREVILKLTDLGIPALNSLALLDLTGDKLSMHHFLAEKPFFNNHLPLTIPYSRSSLRILLQDHDIIFAKPIAGFEARGVLRIAKTSEKYSYHYYDHERKLSEQTNLSWNDFCDATSFLDKEAYILQQGIRPAQYEQSNFELRLILQQDAGQSFIVSRIARLTGKRNLPLITAQSERWQPATLVLDTVFANGHEILIEAEIMTLNLCKEFASAGLNASEFALDFIVDEQGKLWILEVNAKPASFLVQTGETEARRFSLAAKLNQARFLLNPNS